MKRATLMIIVFIAAMAITISASAYSWDLSTGEHFESTSTFWDVDVDFSARVSAGTYKDFIGIKRTCYLYQWKMDNHTRMVELYISGEWIDADGFHRVYLDPKNFAIRSSTPIPSTGEMKAGEVGTYCLLYVGEVPLFPSKASNIHFTCDEVLDGIDQRTWDADVKIR